MADMLVPLLSLPSSAPVLDELKQQGVIVRRAIPSNGQPYALSAKKTSR